MGPKKKDPNAPTLITEDTFIRSKKLFDLKVQMKQPKGELTHDEWCVPPYLHSMPEFKQAIHYWQQCATVRYTEREMKPPTRLKDVDEMPHAQMKQHPRKEIQDLWKFMKNQVKGGTKRSGQFLKQLEKKETKEIKRENLIKQINEVDKAMNDELRATRTFAANKKIFDPRYMQGSKLGEIAPLNKVLIAMELSDKQGAWIDEAKDEVVKLMNMVVNYQTDTFNIALFTAGGVQTWCPTFQRKDDPKKGFSDAVKWINKNFSAKSAGGHSYPPAWQTLLQKMTEDEASHPSRLFITCSRSPEGSKREVLDFLQGLREATPPRPLPINAVAFDPEVEGDDDETGWFQEVTAPDGGSFMIDTSASDLVAMDKMLKSVQAKKKQLEKLNKKLEKVEDLSEKVTSDRDLLQVQLSLQRFLENDFAVLDWALKNEVQSTPIPI